MESKWIKILAKTMLFNTIEESALNEMIRCLMPKVVHYGKGQYIALAGDPFSGPGIVLEGQVSIIKEKFDGSRMIMSLLKQGDMFGEMVAFSKNAVWPATVQATEDSTAFYIASNAIVGSCQKTCQGHRTLILNMLGILSEKALLLNRKVEYLSLKSMRGKISAFLLENYHKHGNATFTLDMKRNDIADFLNVSRPSMSRELCRMRDEGIIDFHLSSFRILDPKALENIQE